MSNEITVLLVDDHGLVRKGFRRMLEDDPEIRVVGEATNGQEAIKLAQELHPRVIVMDLAMPGLDGVQATREILKNAPDTAVLILSMYSDDNYVRNALDAGARGYVLKSALDVDLAGAIKDLASGKTVIGPGVLAPHREPDPDYERLTPREKQILELIAKGNSNKEIAAILNLSVNTVSVHRANLMSALGIHRTTELVVWAVKRGWCTCREPPGVFVGRAGQRCSKPRHCFSEPRGSRRRLPLHRCHFRGRYSIPAQQRRVWREVSSRDAGSGLRLSGLRQRRVAGHPADQRHGLAGSCEAAQHHAPLPQRPQRHLHGCHPRRRPGCGDVRHGRGGGGLQQRRFPGHLRHLRGPEPSVSEHRQRAVPGYYRAQRAGRAAGLQQFGAVVRL